MAAMAIGHAHSKPRRRPSRLGCVALSMLRLLVLAPPAAHSEPPTDDVAQESVLFALEAPRVRMMLELASAEAAGRGQARNPAGAAMLYCAAAAYGSLEAQYRLGRMFLAGWGLTQDIAVAATLFRIAAGNGHEGARAMILVTGEREERLPECLTDPDVPSAYS